MSGDLLGLLGHVGPVLERGDESLRRALQLVESYVLLDAASTLQAAAFLIPVLLALLDSIKPSGLALIIKVRCSALWFDSLALGVKHCSSMSFLMCQ